MKRLLAVLIAVAPIAAPAERPLLPLRWTGTAVVATPRGELRLGVRTRIAPFVSARGESWLLSDPRHEVRTLVILPGSGWMERGGTHLPLPDAVVAHERQQYALYGQMQQALRQSRDLARRGVRQVTIPPPAPGGVATSFGFDAAGVLTGGRNIVADPTEATRRISQVFRFSRARPVGGLLWPRRIEILQDGRPYFALTIDTIAVDAPG